MAEFVLYHSPGGCSRVTINALEEGGFSYDDRVVDLSANQQKSPDFLAVNPKGKVPALVVDGRVLTENAAILLFLSVIRPEAGLLPPTDDPVAKAMQWSDLFWCSATLHPAVRQIRMPVRFTTLDPAGVRARGMEFIDEMAEQLERRLSAAPWWYGDRWSIVDVYLYWIYSTGESGGLNVEAYPAICDHADRVQARPSFARALAREERARAEAGLGTLARMGGARTVALQQQLAQQFRRDMQA